MSIGFHPKYRYVVVLLGTQKSGSTNILVCHLPSGAWTYGQTIFDTGANNFYSNFAIDSDGKLILAWYNDSTPDTRLWEWDPDTGGNQPVVEWPALNFGSDGKKSAYEFGIRHMGQGSATLTPAYKVDDATAFTNLSTLADNANLERDVVTPTAHISGFTYLSFKLTASSSDVDADFELEPPDIEIRGKNA